MPNLSITELLVILAILVLLFGAKKIPDLAEGVGKALKRFKETQKDDKSGTSASASPAAPASTATPEASQPVESKEAPSNHEQNKS
jgi:sec-independent protein translocase protein TatA